MYQNLFRTKSIRCVALAASLAPILFTGAAQAMPQHPEDELIPFAQPLPYMPYFPNSEFDDRDVLMSLDGYDVLGNASAVETLEAQIKRLDERIKESKESLNKANLSGDKDRRRAAESRVESLEEARTSLQKASERAKRLAPLLKKVDVKFDNATVAQAAEALSKASGVQIKVDDTISNTTRLTVEARKIGLASILESVALQAGLIIEPINMEKGDIGVELVSPPMLRVNDRVQKFPQSASPWSTRWGTPPTRRFIYTSRVPGVWNYSTGQGSTISRAYANGISAEVMGNIASLDKLRDAISITTGNRVVVSGEKGTTIEVTKPGTVTITEAGKNDKNEDGYWTTVYTLKDGELTKQSRTWDKTKKKIVAPAAPAAPTIAIPDSGSVGFAFVCDREV